MLYVEIQEKFALAEGIVVWLIFYNTLNTFSKTPQIQQII